MNNITKELLEAYGRACIELEIAQNKYQAIKQEIAQIINNSTKTDEK